MSQNIQTYSAKFPNASKVESNKKKLESWVSGSDFRQKYNTVFVIRKVKYMSITSKKGM